MNCSTYVSKFFGRIKLTTEETTLPEKDRDGNTRKRKTAKLTVHNVTDADAGEYVCLAKLDEVTDNRLVDKHHYPSLLLKSG